MSASNWATCPRCFGRALADAKKKAAEATANYGKVPIAEFDALRAAIPSPQRHEFSTLREDYGFVNNNAGSVEVSYSGSCHICGLEHNIETVLHLMEAVNA